MAQFKVDDFLIELSFNSQKVLKGLEKAAYYREGDR